MTNMSYYNNIITILKSISTECIVYNYLSKLAKIKALKAVNLMKNCA